MRPRTCAASQCDVIIWRVKGSFGCVCLENGRMGGGVIVRVRYRSLPAAERESPLSPEGHETNEHAQSNHP